MQSGSIRPRLDRDDVARLTEKGWIEEVLVCGALPEHRLTYRIARSGTTSGLQFESASGAFSILAPKELVAGWTTLDKMSCEDSFLTSAGPLAVIAEKDLEPRCGALPDGSRDLNPERRTG